MRPFAFRLARLERLRAAARRSAQAALACAAGEAARRGELRAALDGRVLDAESRDVFAEGALDGRRLRETATWIEGLRLAARDAAVGERIALDALAAAERAHAEAAREHRVIERLRERRHTRWLDELGREEQKFLDEVHLLRLARGREPEEVR